MWTIQKIAVYYFFFFKEKEAELERYSTELRDPLFSDALVFLILIGLGIIAFIKWYYPKALPSLFSLFLRIDMRVVYSEDTQPINRAFWWFVFLFTGSSYLMVYVVSVFLNWNSLWLPILPLCYFLFLFIALFFIIRLTELKEFGMQQMQLLQQTFFVLGILYLSLFAVFILNVNWADELIPLIYSVTILVFAFRFLKGFRFGLQNNISWYYLILYFCSLEIWPLLFVYHSQLK